MADGWKAASGEVNISESIVSIRRQNEQKFGSWENTTAGGRVYRLKIDGKLGWSAVYLKEVDAFEKTIRFWQEIYDDKNVLREIHEKFPVDLGHRKL
jgi:hypothetical protein